MYTNFFSFFVPLWIFFLNMLSYSIKNCCTCHLHACCHTKLCHITAHAMDTHQAIIIFRKNKFTFSPKALDGGVLGTYAKCDCTFTRWESSGCVKQKSTGWFYLFIFPSSISKFDTHSGTCHCVLCSHSKQCFVIYAKTEDKQIIILHLPLTKPQNNFCKIKWISHCAHKNINYSSSSFWIILERYVC